ncbi:tol-pal system YbgF family protein [Bdellovibrio bacteriovorus]|uniref:tetratricopeptide repeat protein n=1 Tax=Bdellovibrio bacteriovorus TaxID=959 RepID=UPI0035A66E06
MRILVTASLIFLSGCSSFHFISRETPQDAEMQAAQRASEEGEIGNAEKVLAAGRFEEARILFRDFQTRHAQSTFLHSARLGEAEALEGLGRYQESVELNREVYLKSLKYQPAIAALALYRMSFAYEALGDDEKTIASLLDAKRLGEHLSPEVREAEIPARLAVVYARQNREKEVEAYLNQAEKGIARLREELGPQLKKDWLAKTYVQMGSVSTNQLSVENFEEYARSQRWVQIYLIKALKLNDAVWSPRALAKLQETYRDLYTQVESASGREQQSQLGATLVELVDQAELYKPILGQKMNTYEQGFFSFLAEVKKKTETLLYQSGETMGLTEESQQLNSLKRLPRAKESAKPLPLPPKIVPSEDPNL